MRFVFEQLLLEYSKEIEKQFFDTFTNGDEKEGRKLLDTFDKSKQLLINNGISNNIQKWISDAKKDPSKVEELKNILYNLSTRQNRVDKDFDVRRKRVPGKYKELWRGDGKTLYRIDDVTASMALGVNTGWCTTGRYGHYGEPNFVPSRENAERHFNDHENLRGRGTGKLYYLVDDKTGYGLQAYHCQQMYGNYDVVCMVFDDDDEHVETITAYDTKNEIEGTVFDDFVEYTSDIPEFDIEDGVLIKYMGKSSDVVIPDGVTSIGDEAFYGRDELTSVKISNGVREICLSAFSSCPSLVSVEVPDSVTRIESYAFSGCRSLESINIPSGVRHIGDCAFTNCSSLTDISIPDNIVEIGARSFYGCTNLTNVYIGNKVRFICGEAFAECSSLENISIPDSVEYIEAGAFWGCESLTEITIPDSVTNIGNDAFYGCQNLTSVKIGSGVGSIGNSVFSKCKNLENISIDGANTAYCVDDGVIYSRDKSKLIFYPNKKYSEFIVPDEVRYICPSAFIGCTYLESIVLPNVKFIGSCAFIYCHKLQFVTLTKSIAVVDDCAFMDSSVKDVYYSGTESDWRNISIRSGNIAFRYANIHFNQWL